MHSVLTLERHLVFYDTLDEVDESDMKPERDGECVVVTAKLNNLGQCRKLFIICPDVADGDLVRGRLKDGVGGLEAFLKTLRR